LEKRGDEGISIKSRTDRRCSAGNGARNQEGKKEARRTENKGRNREDTTSRGTSGRRHGKKKASEVVLMGKPPESSPENKRERLKSWFSRAEVHPGASIFSEKKLDEWLKGKCYVLQNSGRSELTRGGA